MQLKMKDPTAHLIDDHLAMKNLPDNLDNDKTGTAARGLQAQNCARTGRSGRPVHCFGPNEYDVYSQPVTPPPINLPAAIQPSAPTPAPTTIATNAPTVAPTKQTVILDAETAEGPTTNVETGGGGTEGDGDNNAGAGDGENSTNTGSGSAESATTGDETGGSGTEGDGDDNPGAGDGENSTNTGSGSAEGPTTGDETGGSGTKGDGDNNPGAGDGENSTNTSSGSVEGPTTGDETGGSGTEGDGDNNPGAGDGEYNSNTGSGSGETGDGTSAGNGEDGKNNSDGDPDGNTGGDAGDGDGTGEDESDSGPVDGNGNADGNGEDGTENGDGDGKGENGDGSDTGSGNNGAETGGEGELAGATGNEDSDIGTTDGNGNDDGDEENGDNTDNAGGDNEGKPGAAEEGNGNGDGTLGNGDVTGSDNSGGETGESETGSSTGGNETESGNVDNALGSGSGSNPCVADENGDFGFTDVFAGTTTVHLSEYRYQLEVTQDALFADSFLDSSVIRDVEYSISDIAVQALFASPQGQGRADGGCASTSSSPVATQRSVGGRQRWLRIRQLVDGEQAEVVGMTAAPPDGVLPGDEGVACPFPISTDPNTPCFVIGGGLSILGGDDPADDLSWVDPVISSALETAMNSGQLNSANPGIVAIRFIPPGTILNITTSGPAQVQRGGPDEISARTPGWSWVIIGFAFIALAFIMTFVAMYRRRQAEREDALDADDDDFNNEALGAFPVADGRGSTRFDEQQHEDDDIDKESVNQSDIYNDVSRVEPDTDDNSVLINSRDPNQPIVRPVLDDESDTYVSNN